MKSYGSFDEAVATLGVANPVPAPAPNGATPLEVAIASAINTGGSGRGMSYYSAAARCGRRARLSEERREAFTAAGRDGLPRDKNAFAIGSIYHLLHQQAREPRADLELDFSDAYTNINVIEALRMYRGWMNVWGRDYWGRTLAVERKLPESGAEVREAIARTFGAQVNGTVDMVVELGDDDAVRAQRRLPGIQAGRYVLDWKTADSDADGVAYALGLQAMWYPALWNWCYPDAPVSGIIFDVALKRGRRRDRAMYADDFQAFFVETAQNSHQRVVSLLRGMVRQGRLNVLHDVPNRAECVDWRGQTCPFLNGECDGELKSEDYGG